MQWTLLLYPFLVHAAILTNSPVLEWAAILLLGWNLLQPWLVQQRRPIAYAGLATVLVAGTGAVTLGDGRLFLYAAPVLIFLALMGLFGQTLLPGRRPLITAIAATLRGPLPPRVARYTRRLTLLWTGLFALMGLVNALLAVFAPPAVWSLFANFVNYLIVALVFALEWPFRLWYLGDEETLSLSAYLRGLLRVDYRRFFS